MSEKVLERYPLDDLLQNVKNGRVTRIEYVEKLIRQTAGLDAGLLFRLRSNPYRFTGTIQQCFLAPYCISPEQLEFMDPDENEDIVDLAYFMAFMTCRMKETNPGTQSSAGSSNEGKDEPPLFTKKELRMRQKCAKQLCKYMNLCVLDVFEFLNQHAERFSFNRNTAAFEAKIVLEDLNHRALLGDTKVYTAVKLLTQDNHCLKDFNPMERRLLEWLLLYPMWMQFPKKEKADAKSV